MTDTFFDLQRFAVLVGGQSSFTWKDGETFGPTGTSAAIGTSALPAYLLATGGASEAGTGTEIYLNGDKSYTFSLDGKTDWSLKLSSAGLAQVVNNGVSGASNLELSNLEDTAAVLNLNGTFEESFNGNNVYIKTAVDTKATLTSPSSLLVEKFAKNTTGVDLVFEADSGVQAQFAKGASDIALGTSVDSIADGFAFEKAVTVAANSAGDGIGIISGNNTITAPDGDVWAVKKISESVAPELNFNIADNSFDSVMGIKNATLTSADGFVTDLVIGTYAGEGTEWNAITGGISTVVFDSLGSAKINNTGAVNVKGEDGAIATVQNLTSDGASINGAEIIAASADGTAAVTFTLETVAAGTAGGIAQIDVSKALGKDLTLANDMAVSVVAGKTTYLVATAADAVTFNATASQVEVDAENAQSYVADGGNARFDLTAGTTLTTLNGAQVSVQANDGVYATASDGNAGIDVLAGIAANQAVSVSGDGDGFTTTFNTVDVDGEVVFQVNNASIKAAGVNDRTVSISINGAGTDALVTGMGTTDSVTVAGTGITYHFKDATAPNAIAVASEAIYVTLNSDAIADAMDDANFKKLANDQAKWDDIASIGNDQYRPDENGDPVKANRSTVYEQFYDLDISEAGQQTVAVFANEDSTVLSSVANPNGITFSGRNSSLPLAQNGHITLTAGSNVGAAPINIQCDESSAVVDAVIDLRSATLPSTVAVGTLGNVEASHTIYLSNAGTGYAEIGSGATGQNQIFAGTGGAQIRHDGERATVYGNRGDDTIWAGQYDIVRGSLGADQFYDSANYTILDYNAAEGDALIATRLHSIDDVTKANVISAGNVVSFGTGRKSFTIGEDQNSSLSLNVAVMDSEANVVGSRSVVLAGANGGQVDASGLTAGSLILADADRNGLSGDNITGTAYADDIYIGANDIVNAGAGNDYITIGSISSASGAEGATVILGSGKNTVEGWTFGFDQNAGATELIAAEGYVGTFENDRLKVTDANGSILFEDTKQTALHGQYDVIVNGRKYTAIRTNDSNNTNPVSYGYVESNADIADVYLAEREGFLTFGSGVTENLGEIKLGSTEFQNITNLTMLNNSKVDVYGTSGRETVAVSGDASVGANKRVSLGAGNDVIISTGDSSVTAGHEFYFGTEDGRDTIRGFSHYLGGVESDPDKQYADTLILEKFGGLYTGTAEDGGSRIEFVTEGDNRVFLYEADGINVDKMYQIKVGAFDTKLAKIGNSNGSNLFALDANVDYYVGSSAENAQDTLTVSNIYDNVNVWLDGSNGTDHTSADEHYFRGIKVVDAGAETDTNVSIAGAGGNDTLIAGGAGTYNYLWGGSGDNVLIGSTSSNQDYFFYVRSAGAYLQTVDDTVTGGHDEVYNYDFENNDVIWLGDTTLDDISGTTIEDNAVTIEFKNGGSLTVNSTDDVRVRINEGAECYIADKETGTWSHE